MTRFLRPAAFLAGLAALAWVAAGAVPSNPLVLVMTLLIAAGYLGGALELRRYDQASAGLARALQAPPAAGTALAAWLDTVPAALRTPVRQRVDGERAGLPAPVLAPYLAGLLVLLGMLGTFLGMVVTLHGTGAALDQATSLLAMRDSLSGPVKGLGLAFGTSVAGVAGSAMLGLLVALSRRERLAVAQSLDAALAGPLRVHTPAERRDAELQTLREHTVLLQRQGELLAQQTRWLEQQATAVPALVERLQAAMTQTEQQNARLGAQLLDNQTRFHDQTAEAYRALAGSVDRSLGQSLTDSARAATATIQPVVEATMQGITRETAALHGRIAEQVERQLDGYAQRFEATTRGVAEGWQAALARHEAATGAVAGQLERTLDGFGARFEERSTTLVGAVAETQRAWQAEMAAAVGGLTAAGLAQQERLAGTTGEQLATIGARLDATVAGLARHWDDALARQEQTGSRLADDTARALQAAVQGLAQHGASLVGTLHEAQAALQSRLEARDTERLDGWTARLDAVATTLQQGWDAASQAAVARQQSICDTLEATARDITAQAEAHARGTVDEIGRLVQAAAEAPRAAAELVAQLREQLSDSLARDTAMLDERRRILETLGGLLDTVQHAATQQKAAIDDLVAGATTLLDGAGQRHAAQVDAQAARLETLAVELGSGAVEVASLGDALGTAVQRFDQANDKLVGQLQRIEQALGKSLTRSDEQLAYYVAQAREVIDLSLSAQQQIVEDLQRLAASRRVAAEQEA